MSILKIKKLLNTKEKVARLKANKILNEINNKKSNISAIDDYRRAYLATSRKIKDISGYDLSNIEAFTGNMAGVSAIETNDIERLRGIYDSRVDFWKKCLKKSNICDEMIYNIGIDNASIIEEGLTDEINWLNILKKMENGNG
jgi:hypothetical protein